MFFIKKTVLCFFFFTRMAFAAQPDSLTDAELLHWMPDSTTSCGGSYLEEPIHTASSAHHDPAIEIASDQGMLSQRATSILEGRVTATQENQQLIANKAYLYRDPASLKFDSMEMVGDVQFREPNVFILAKRAKYNLVTKTKSLFDILYRTSLDQSRNLNVPGSPQPKQILNAWGKAAEFSQTSPKIVEMNSGTFTTCPPVDPTWQLKASHIVLDKNTGRGYATHARILVKDIPVFYFPYFNFPLDKTRKSGFLWPMLGHSGKWGSYTLIPFYWNLAPNYDTTITPGLYSQRGIQLTDKFRYLSTTNHGEMTLSALPNDVGFDNRKGTLFSRYQSSPDHLIQAELQRLMSSSSTRRAFAWRDDAQYNANWSSYLDFNYASDDYYLQDFGNDLNEITQNQLLQQVDLNYNSQHWHFLGRLQSYQTLHPLVENETPVQNQYRRLPQLSLTANYPDQFFGLDYFTTGELTHFEILQTPGTTLILPVGNRFHLQPGVSLPLSTSYYFITPRLQFALTQYQLDHTESVGTQAHFQRGIPMLDVVQGMTLQRELSLFNQPFKQTLEPQLYYTYIPYHNQSQLPVFDTTLNTLTYDQIFNPNRFSGIDRIGDANQLALGITTRFIDQTIGIEKVRLGLGQILYFADRRVTLCQGPACPNHPEDSDLTRRLSPLSGLFNYNINPLWALTGNAIWNPISREMDNATIALHYEPQAQKIINLGFSYAKKGDYFSSTLVSSPQDKLKITDISFGWPMTATISAVGRWSQDWSQDHFQNLLYGLQYDTCCWAVRLVGGKAFNDLSTTNQPSYNAEYYLQFALKGLGNLGSGNPSSLLNAITGYNTQFGQEF